MPKRSVAPRARKPASRAASVLRLKVTLLEAHPPIWRRVEVPADMTLDELHDVLQVAMGWTDSHLHDFEKAGIRYAAPDPDGYDKAEDTAEVTIGALLKRRKEKLTYQYDSGDSWYHEVMLEEVAPAEAGVTYPRCIDGQRACPPEDVGGVHGYENFLAAIANPEHEDHEEMLEWGGDDFDAEAFDLERVNRTLKR